MLRVVIMYTVCKKTCKKLIIKYISLLYRLDRDVL